MQDMFSSNKNRQRISPSSEASESGGEATVTSTGIASTVAGADQAMDSCLIKPNPDNVGTVHIRAGGGAASVNSPQLDAAFTAMPFSNTNLLSFYFSAADDKVHIIWRKTVNS